MTAISQAILSKDVDAAQKAIKTHLDDASDIARRLLTRETEGAV